MTQATTSIIEEKEFVDFREQLEDADYFTRHQEELRTKKAFNDFLIVGEIAGIKKGFSETNVLGREYLDDRGTKVEVGENSRDETEGNHGQTVLVHRNAYDEVESIEVVCSCGKKTIVRLEYEKPELAEDDEEFDLANYDEDPLVGL